MSVAIGQELSFAKEVTFGTGIATPAKRWDFSGVRPKPRFETYRDADRKTGVYERGTFTRRTKQWVELSAEFDGRLDTLISLLKAAMGSYAVSGAGTFTHTLTVKQGDIDSYTVFWKDAFTGAGKLEQFAGCKIGSITITGTQGAQVVVAVEFVGKGSNSATGGTEVTATQTAKTSDTVLLFAEVSAFTIGGVSYAAALQEFEIRIVNNFNRDREFGAGSYLLNKLERTGVEVTGRFNLNAENTALMTPVYNKSGTPVVLTIGTTGNQITFTIPKAVLDDGTVEGDDKLGTNITFWADYDSATSKAINVVAMNATESYATF